MRTKEERSDYSWRDKQFLLSIDKKEGQVDRPVQRLYPFFTLPKALWGLEGLNRRAKLHAFFSLAGTSADEASALGYEA